MAVMQAYLDDHESGGREGVKFAQADMSKIKCFYCKELGHMRRDCPKKQKLDETMNSKYTKVVNVSKELAKNKILTIGLN